MRPRASIIALLTDFGLQDSYVGVIKGVILGIDPTVRLVDICHDVRPGDIRAAAFLLERSVSFFPAGTVFLTVVDPEVGGERRGLAVAAGGWHFVGPDNGVFSYILDRSNEFAHPIRVVSLTRRAYWLPRVSHTFHGRDVFAPVAARLSRGLPIGRLGEAIVDPVKIPLPHCRTIQKGLEGEIVHVDRFGNLVTSIRSTDIQRLAGKGQTITVRVKGRAGATIHESYSAVPEGAPLAVIGGFDYLEVSVNGGSAAAQFGAQVGDPVMVRVRNAAVRKK